MRILLTGGTGFIGKSILNSYLKDKYEILAPTRQELNLLSTDQLSDYMYKHMPDIIVHAAVDPNEDLQSMYNNVFMYQNIVRFSTMVDKIIDCNSGAAYGREKNLKRVKEDNFGLTIPTDFLGFGKYLNALHGAHLPNVTELFIFGIFGKYEQSKRFFKSVMYNSKFQIPTVMTHRYMSYIFIDDFLCILDKFISDTSIDLWQRYNITSDETYSLVELFNIITDTIGVKYMYIKEGKQCTYSGSNDRLRKKFTDIKFTPIEVAIAKMWEELE